MSDLRQLLRSRIESISDPWMDKQPAWLGDLDGVVITSIAGVYNARLINGDVVEVYNYARVPSDFDLPVKIGRHRDAPTIWQIIEGRQVWTVPAAGNRVEYHREQHEEGGADRLHLDRKQIIQLSVRVVSAFTVRVYGGLAGNVKIDTQLVDLSGYVVTEGAKFVAIESDADGVLSVHEGTAYESPEAAAASDLPVPDAGKATRAYVLLYAGQTALVDENIVVPWPPDGITDAASLAYDPADVNDWDYTADPGDVGDGLDQLAARVTDLEATPPGSWDGDITDLDETSSVDIGEGIADTDQGILYNTSGAAWVRFAWSRVKTYIQALTDTLYADISEGVTNGDSHDHNGGDGAQISFLNLSNSFDDSEGDPAAIGTAADGTSNYAARRDHVHAMVYGQSVLGSDFSITGTTGTFQDTGLSVTLPSAGTYEIIGSIRGAISGSAGAEYIVAKLYNSTDAADVTNSETLVIFAQGAGTNNQNTVALVNQITVAASKTIKLYAARNYSGSITFSLISADSSGKSRMAYKKVG